MSRSGIAIAAGMFFGLSRSDATRFSFLLAIPIIAGAGSIKGYELLTTGSSAPLGPVLIGAAVAFATGLLAIHIMVSFVRRYSLWPFIWYRIILAGFIVFFTFF
jgi:undecaprenyl-diphosphatase